MADVVFNAALGRARHLASLPDTNGALTWVLLQAVEADDALRDHDTLAAVLGAAGNTEADFTNYARKVVTTPGGISVDDTANSADVDTADQTWTEAGGTTNNGLVKVVIAYDPDTTVADDAAMIPLTAHDVAVTTDGTDVTISVDPAGFVGAS